MKKGDLIQGVVREVKFPNKGIVVTEEGLCVVKNAITGQIVRARVNKKRKGKAEAALISVLERSPLERETPCPVFGICGGCTYLCLPYEEQCRIKERQVRELLEEAMPEGGSMDWFHGILGSPEVYGYRNKMEFSFGDSFKDGPLALGMHKRGSFYDIVNADSCVIVDGDYRKILTAVRTYWEEKGASFFHRLRHTGYLRHLLVRKAVNTGEILIDLVTTSQEQYDLQDFASMLKELKTEGTIVGILHTVNDAVADVIKDDGTELLYGRDYFTETLLGLQFKVTPFSFFQTNSRGAEVLYDTARKFLTEAGMKKGVVYDLYCGTGTISQLMAPVSEKVIGVEIVEEAVEAAAENAKRNGIDNCEFIAGDVLKVLDEIEEKPDLIILDPPRDGVHPKALPKILGYGVEQILYISCKPTSLARDIPVFTESGYKPVRGICVDQFPWTANVETVVLLSREKVNGYVDIDLDVEKLASKTGTATYAEIKAYVEKEHGLNVSNLCIAQIKNKVGLEKRKNYNTGEGKSRIPNCPPEKEDAIMNAFRYFNLI